MKVWFVAAEGTPFAKAGGLADVIGALPEALENEGAQVTVILPFYSSIPQMYKDKMAHVTEFHVQVGWRDQYCGIKRLTRKGVDYLFLDNDFYFGRPELYGYHDDGERFAFFEQAVLAYMMHVDEYPEILHCHDWHTAMIPVLLSEKHGESPKFQAIKTVYTIHNLMFQGIFDAGVLKDWYDMGYESFHLHGLEFHGQINKVKGAIYYSDLVNTVSPTYAKEIMTPQFGCRLEKVLQENAFKIKGILNGFDTETYNPEKNNAIPHPYSVKTVHKKAKNKSFLQKKVGLRQDKDVFLLGMVTRLTNQKGLQLFQPILSDLMESNVQLVVLGTGDPFYESLLKEAEARYPDKIRVSVSFDADFAQEIYAGVDAFLMPSEFEPCGIAQLNAMHYGTIPIVHETGGLVDTVAPFNDLTGEGTGFSFYDFRPHVFLDTIHHAADVFWNQKKRWTQLQRAAMKKEVSWAASARRYFEEYTRLLMS